MVAHRGQFDHSETDWVIEDPGDAGAINPTMSGVCNLVVSASAETRTLAAPAYVGQWIVVNLNTCGGGVITLTVATNVNTGGTDTIATFGTTAGEFIHLVGVTLGTTLTWRAVAPMGTDTDHEGPTWS